MSYQGSYTAYSDEEDGANAKGDWLDSKSKGKNNNKEWVIQNVDGITRFDVVFSPSKLKYEQAERDSPNGRYKPSPPNSIADGINPVYLVLFALDSDVTVPEHKRMQFGIFQYQPNVF